MLNIGNLSKSFDQGRTYALKDVSFELDAGNVCAIVGESGSGKTTLVRLIAGLERPDRGTIALGGMLMSSMDKFVAPEKRRLGLVFQEYALFPHLTIRDNIRFGISKLKDKNERVAEMLELVGLQGMEKRYPHQLSGGQQQRVALARALAPHPSLLILDEPFSNLDSILRAELRDEIFDIIRKTEVTALFVTHDTRDAMTVADEILILQEGQLVQKDIASNLYGKPESLYVASLFGDTVRITRSLQEAFRCPLRPDCCHAIRNEKLQINADCEYITAARVMRRTVLGDSVQLTLRLENGELLTVMTRDADVADELKIGFNSADLLEFKQ
ncbi:MAG TPA: ABC transporter ATP-binding protein [Cryomorphaceae bacterium]|nr:ABC transporter ATP-binding protein [Cryomorphaceae bacterium]